MLIQQEEDETSGKFYVEKDGKALAELVYAKRPGRIIIQHTEVDDSLRGQNVGFQLVEHAVEYARQQKIKVVPLCTFANKVIKEHEEFHDVL